MAFIRTKTIEGSDAETFVEKLKTMVDDGWEVSKIEILPDDGFNIYTANLAITEME